LPRSAECKQATMPWEGPTVFKSAKRRCNLPPACLCEGTVLSKRKNRSLSADCNEENCLCAKPDVYGDRGNLMNKARSPRLLRARLRSLAMTEKRCHSGLRSGIPSFNCRSGFQPRSLHRTRMVLLQSKITASAIRQPPGVYTPADVSDVGCSIPPVFGISLLRPLDLPRIILE
jgi:hypothetical protein